MDADNDIVVKCCIYCGEKVYIKVDCWAKKADESGNESDVDSVHGLGCEDPGKNLLMCIECETDEHYVPSGDMFMLQINTVDTKENKCGHDANSDYDTTDAIPKLDSEERE